MANRKMSYKRKRSLNEDGTTSKKIKLSYKKTSKKDSKKNFKPKKPTTKGSSDAIVKKQWSRYDYPLWTQSKWGACRSMYSQRLRINSLANYQRVSPWVFPFVPNSVPTLDPGTASMSAISKIYFDQMQDATVGNRTRKILLDRCEFDFDFVSGSEGIQWLEVYDCVCRQDTFIDPETLYTTGLKEINAGCAFVDGSSGVGSTINITRDQLGQTPFDSTDFCRIWKVVRKRLIKMMPGSLHKHTAKFDIKKVIDAQSFRDGSIYAKDISCMVMTRQWGMPAGDAQLDCGITPTVIYQDMKFRLHWKKSSHVTQDLNYNYDNSVLTAAIAGAQFINPLNGLVDATMNIS